MEESVLKSSVGQQNKNRNKTHECSYRVVLRLRLHRLSV